VVVRVVEGDRAEQVGGCMFGLHPTAMHPPTDSPIEGTRMTNQSVATRNGITTIAARDPLEEKRDLIRRTVAKDTTDDELELFFIQCRRTGLDPFSRQIYCIKRSGRATIQTGIDGYRLIADRTGAYAGSDDAEFDEGAGHPTLARVTVWKLVHGQRYAFTATARWDEYKPESNAPMWAKMPHTMLAKCFDEQTEVLTDHGFKRFRDVEPHMRVLQVTDTGVEPTDARPFFQAWDGNMITLNSDDLNFSVTPNHDMVTTDGKVEAGDMYDAARARARHFIPRVVTGSGEGSWVPDLNIELAAAYLADGSDIMGGFRIAVSRPEKVQRLREMGGEVNITYRQSAGAEAHTAVRTITTRANKTQFSYQWDQVSWLCISKKGIKTDALLSLSRRQARLFVDTLLAFDGHVDKKSGVRRFYSSRLDHMAAFELACVIAGYSVSQRRSRTSDISARPNYYVTVSSRSDIPVLRWGRDYHKTSHGTRKHTGLEVTQNTSGFVWCVTVPSGEIVVRRNGFSMRCGNCAEALALRKAFPQELSGIYTDTEMDQAGMIEATATVVEDRPTPRAPAPKQVKEASAPALVDAAFLRELVTLGTDAGIEPKQIDAYSKKTFQGRGPRELTREQAQDVRTWILNQAETVAPEAITADMLFPDGEGDL